MGYFSRFKITSILRSWEDFVEFMNIYVFAYFIEGIAPSVTCLQYSRFNVNDERPVILISLQVSLHITFLICLLPVLHCSNSPVPDERKLPQLSNEKK